MLRRRVLSSDGMVREPGQSRRGMLSTGGLDELRRRGADFCNFPPRDRHRVQRAEVLIQMYIRRRSRRVVWPGPRSCASR